MTAVCAHNDDVALVTLQAIRDLHLSAPADLAIIGSDDVPLAQHELTTVALDLDVCASMFVNHVLTALGEPADPSLTEDLLHLIERNSA